MKKTKNIVVLFIICLFIFIVPLNLVGCSSANKDDTKPNNFSIEVSWKTVKKDKEKIYEATLVSNSKSNFIAAVLEHQEYSVNHKLVYVNNGEGKFTTPYKETKNRTYEFSNYIEGYTIDESQISITEGYYSNGFPENTIQLYDGKSGLLLYHIVDANGTICSSDIYMPIVKGQGIEDCCWIKKNEHIIPKFFCEVTPIQESDYTVISPMKTEMDHSYGSYGDYCGDLKLKMNNIRRGFILTTCEVIFKHKKTGEVIHTGLKETELTPIDEYELSIWPEVSAYDLEQKNLTDEYEVDFEVINHGIIPWHEITTK